MPKNIRDLLTYAALVFFLALAFMMHGCAATAPPATSDIERLPIESAVFLRAGDGRCSGVAIDKHHFLTAKHCTEVGPFEVEAFPGVRGPAELVHAYPDRDVALMRTPLELKALARVAPQGAHVPAGDLVVLVGFGCTGDLFVAAGVYLGVRSDGRLTAAMSACRGDSGGPVFDKQGRVVGVLSGMVDGISVTVSADVRGL